jgi:hypothetical protein
MFRLPEEKANERQVLHSIASPIPNPAIAHLGIQSFIHMSNNSNRESENGKLKKKNPMTLARANLVVARTSEIRTDRLVPASPPVTRFLHYLILEQLIMDCPLVTGCLSLSELHGWIYRYTQK